MQEKKFCASLVQLRSGMSVEPNIENATSLIREAAAGGADYVQTPENTALMVLSGRDLFPNIHEEDGNPAVGAFRALAKELKIWLHIGGMAVRVSETQAANRAFLISPEGEITARYDKIHMFDVELPGGETYRESKNYAPGDKAVVADLPWGKLGMTICYDLRFPHLYRTLAQAGAKMLTVPAAFTKITGKAHWHTLLRARAIENGCFVFAAAQGGSHEVGRDTYGHSIIIAPWGEVLAEAGTDPCVIYADVDLSKVDEARGRVPSLQHDRDFSLSNASGEPA